jgi:hypothetical protein
VLKRGIEKVDLRCERSTEHFFYVDTLANPPRSIWVHPYDVSWVTLVLSVRTNSLTCLHQTLIRTYATRLLFYLLLAPLKLTHHFAFRRSPSTLPASRTRNVLSTPIPSTPLPSLTTTRLPPPLRPVQLEPRKRLATTT